MTQEHHVFLGTLRENVALARSEASDDEVREALAAVDAWEWAEQLPTGLDTEFGSAQIAAVAGPGAAGRTRPTGHR